MSDPVLPMVDLDDDFDSDADPEPMTDPPEFFKALIEDVRQNLHDQVYPPSDDTFLVLQSFLDDRDMLRRMK